MDANVCPYCGHDYRPLMTAPAQQKKESGLPVAGGVLILIASLGYLVVGGLMVGGSAIAFAPSLGGTVLGVICGLVLLILGVVAILGGISAIQRKSFALALIGGVLVIPSVLGLIGLILVAVSRDEFRD